MLLPAVWQNNKRKSSTSINLLESKRQRIKIDQEREQRVVDEILCIIQHTVENYNADPEHDVIENLKIDTQCILNDIPFERLLGTISNNNVMPSVPIITRLYEERFMRECMSADEKPCVMGDGCECMILDPKTPFVCMQFVIPNVTNEYQGMCVLCLRKTTQLLYYKTIYNGIDVNALIQKYGNICNQVDEYHPSVMLICPPNGPVNNMPVPIVSHQRNRYKIETISGIKYIKQLKVGMADFQ